MNPLAGLPANEGQACPESRRLAGSHGLPWVDRLGGVLPEVLPETRSALVSSEHARAFETAIAGYRRSVAGPYRCLEDCKSAIPGSNPGGAFRGSHALAVASAFSFTLASAWICAELPEVLPETAA